MKTPRTSLWAVLFAVASARAATLPVEGPALAELAWMAGHWGSEADGTRTEEVWLDPAGGIMPGLNRSVRAGRTDFEYLRIEQRDDLLVYVASPGGGGTTEFPLKQLGPRSVVFENPEHDFPSAIRYELTPEGKLHVRASGDPGSGERVLEWTWEKQPPAPVHAPPPVTARLEPYTCGTIQRLHTYAGIFLASQPSPDDFEQAKAGGVRTVVNLRHPSEIDFDERALVASLGIAYHEPAWNGVDELTDDVLDRNRALLRTAERPLLLHCASSNRVGAVWLAYRLLDEDAPIEQALAEAKEVGLKTPDYQARVLEYVEAHRESAR